MSQHLFLISFNSRTRYSLRISNSSSSRLWKNKWVTNWRVIHDTVARGLVFTARPTMEDLWRSNSCVFHETRSIVLTQRRFRQQFYTQWAPCNRTIHTLYEKCVREGTILDPKRHTPKPVCSLENMEAIRVALQRSPDKSYSKSAVQLGISRRSVQRIPKSNSICTHALWPLCVSLLMNASGRDYCLLAGQSISIVIWTVVRLTKKMYTLGYWKSTSASKTSSSWSEYYCVGLNIQSRTYRTLFPSRNCEQWALLENAPQ